MGARPGVVVVAGGRVCVGTQRVCTGPSDDGCTFTSHGTLDARAIGSFSLRGGIRSFEQQTQAVNRRISSGIRTHVIFNLVNGVGWVIHYTSREGE